MTHDMVAYDSSAHAGGVVAQIRTLASRCRPGTRLPATSVRLGETVNSMSWRSDATLPVRDNVVVASRRTLSNKGVTHSVLIVQRQGGIVSTIALYGFNRPLTAVEIAGGMRAARLSGKRQLTP